MSLDEDKILTTKKLLNSISKKTISSVDNWKDFLDTASNIYKYSFSEQLLIHAQNPDVEVCASMDFWQDNLNRYVGENSNSIALLKKDEHDKPYIEYVFDIKDTKETNVSKTPQLWELKDRDNDYVLAFLSKKYGEVTNNNFVDNLLELTKKSLNINLNDYLDKFTDTLNNSYLKDIPKQIREDLFKDLVIASSQFTILSRCGIDPNLYIDDVSFKNLKAFNTNNVIASLGNAIQDVSKHMLVDIGKICNNIEKNIEQSRQKTSKAIEIEYNSEYNKVNLKNNDFGQKDLDIENYINDGSKGVTNNGKNNVHQDRRLQYPQYSTGRGNGQSTRPSGQMGENEGQVSIGYRQSNMDVDRGEFVGRYLPSRQSSDRTIRVNNEPTTQISESDGTNEEFERGATTSTKEYNSNASRGNNQDRNNLRSTLTNEQLNKIISHSINFEKKSDDIVAYFNNNFKTHDRIDFLKANLVSDENLFVFKGQVLGFELKDDTLNLFASNGLSKVAEKNITLNELNSYISNVLIPNSTVIEVEVLDTSKISGTLLSVEDNIAKIHENYIKENPETVFDEKSKIIEQTKDIMFSELSQECKNILKIRGDEDYLTKVFTNEKGKDFSLSYANLGNGTTISNRLDTDKEINDWVNVAHIDNVGHISYHVDDLPLLAIEDIQEHANEVFDKIKDEYLPLKEQAIEKISKSYYALDGMIPELKSDRDVILAGVVNDGRAFAYASIKLKKDEELLNVALETSPRMIQFASKEFIEKNKELCFDIVKKDPFCMIYLSDTNLTEDKDFVLTAVENKGVNLEYAPLFQNDLDVVLKALIQDNNSFEYAGEKLKEQLGNTVDEFIKNANISLSGDTLNVNEGTIDNEINNVVSDLTLRQVGEKLTNEEKIGNQEKQSKDVDLTYEEQAIYNILVALPEQYNFEYGTNNEVDGAVINNECKLLAKKVNEIIETKSSLDDWLNNKNVRDQLKLDIKICLVKNDYPPQYSTETFNKIMEQVENSNNYIDAQNKSDVKPVQSTEPTMTKEQALEIVANKGEQLLTLDDKFKDDFDEKIFNLINTELTDFNNIKNNATTQKFDDFKSSCYRTIDSIIKDKTYSIKTNHQISDDKKQEVLEKLDTLATLKESVFDDNKLQDLYNSLREPKVIEILENKDSFSSNKQKAIDKVVNSGSALKDLGDLWKNDKDVVMVAMNENVRAFQYADVRLKDDLDLVSMLLEKVPELTHLLSEDFKVKWGITDVEILSNIGREQQKNVVVENENTVVLDKSNKVLEEQEQIKADEPKENVGQVGTHLNDKEKVTITKEQSLDDILPVGKEIHIDDMHLFVNKIDKNYVIFDDKAMIDIGMETVMKVQIELSRVLEHIEKEEIKANVVDVDSLINQEEFTSDDIFGFDDELEEFIEEIKDTKVNFKIKDEDIENTSFSPKEKFQNNVKAIETLKEIESENRLSTPNEQEILSKYVGWGGLSDAFDDRKNNWSNEYSKLKDLLTESEYDNARESTLTAFYTPTVVVDTMYKALENMGLPNDINILDSSMGIGNFMGKAEETFGKCQLNGTELDSITGRIATQLYQKANIEVNGFEKTKHKDNSFDVSIGNVPFGDIKVNDKDYDKLNFLIHDYFFAKILDKVRNGGIVALVTSKGTMDKKDSRVREYLNERADFLGAIRLPDTTFKANANTDVTSDIIFLQRHDDKTQEEIENSSKWLHLSDNGEGITMNNYFIENPNMIMGAMEVVSGRYGDVEVCKPNLDTSLKEQLEHAINNLTQPNKVLLEYKAEIDVDSKPNKDILDLPKELENVDNYSFVLFDEKLYFKENDMLTKSDMKELVSGRLKNPTKIQEKAIEIEDRIINLVSIRDKLKEILNLQVNNCDNLDLRIAQQELNNLYDDFVDKFGNIQNKENNVFSQDISYPLLRSLEKEEKIDDKVIYEKSDIFSKRTIKNTPNIESVENSIDALGVSIGKTGKVDLELMQELMAENTTIDGIIEDLTGVIFKNPLSDMENLLDGWENADEYLSGNVREKLEIAEKLSETYPELLINVEKLKEVQPTLLKASEIEVTLGANWIDLDYYKQFVFETFDIPSFMQEDRVNIEYEINTANWSIKSGNYSNQNINFEFGTKEANAFKILEDTLNKKYTKIYDIKKVNGETQKTFNELKTLEVSNKREKIENAFNQWIFKDPTRRRALVEKYNVIFNSVKPRVFNGDHIEFSGMSSQITLQKHQKDGVARCVYGGNTQLAYEVGAGKTFTMISCAMENKKIGKSNKAMIVVPKHLVQQVGTDAVRLYPNAKVLVASEKEFSAKERKHFCSKIATNDVDIVVLGHTQFEKIPLSLERQQDFFQTELNNIVNFISQNEEKGNSGSVKSLERMKKTLSAKLNDINEKVNSNKDNVINFEELGVDMLIVDEAHEYKNLSAHTKMEGVSGIDKVVQKSSDMHMKCKYLNEKTNETGIVFATGTPITNSVSELFTNMRYLQPKVLKEKGLEHFDNWSSVFAKSNTRMEIKPTGDGVREKTRLSFHNLPELKNIWSEVTDIKMADKLNLQTPNFEIEVVPIPATHYQKELIAEFLVRIDNIEKGVITDRRVDNPLKMCTQGRMASLDQRMINPLFPDDPNSKINTCVNNVFDIYKKTEKEKSTQVIFCDIGTPSSSTKPPKEKDSYTQEIDTIWIDNNRFNAYADIKQKLIDKGVSPDEIAFIHDAKDDVSKEKLFKTFREGKVRVLLGSTQKMGTGTNIQNKLIAIHHLDTPYRPSDIAQRNGRGIRPGNENENIIILNYVSQDTTESYMYELLQSKQMFISQILSDNMTMRNGEDIDEVSLNIAQMKAICTSDPLLREKLELDVEVTKLKNLSQSYINEVVDMQDRIEELPKEIVRAEKNVENMIQDINLLQENPMTKETFKMTIGDKVITEPALVNNEIQSLLKENKGVDKLDIGEYRGFKLKISNVWDIKKVHLENKNSFSVDVEENSNILTRINNNLKKLPEQLDNLNSKLKCLNNELAYTKLEIAKPFPYQKDLVEKSEKLDNLNKTIATKENIKIIVPKKNSRDRGR